ncbi:MAG: helix-hairpin-helix domain-containing protein, partial [Candidatus Lokiarchaeia archaeon]
SNIGNYSGQILSGTISSGSYVLIVQAYKENYTTSFKYLSLDVLGAPTALASAFVIPQLFGSSEYLFAGPLIQVENWWLLVPISFTYLDSYGNPVPNATITVTSGLPVIGAKGKGGVGGSEVQGLQLFGGAYLVLMPISGMPPSTLLINIQASATNYQTQQIPIVLSIKEKAIPFGPFRIPLSVFLLTLAAVAIPTTAFAGYSYYKRAKIPAIIKRIDELIRAISRGEKVTVHLIPREKVIEELMREELAIVEVEPRPVRYIPVELADLIVPLLVESGMQEREAYALAVELKTATPADRERLLESVGIPGESSARIIRTIEEYEESQELFRRAPITEAVEEPEVIEIELEAVLPKLDVTIIEGVGDKLASQLSAVGINTVEDLSKCDPSEVQTRTEIPKHKVLEFKNKALNLLKLKFDDDIIDVLVEKGYSIQQAVEEEPSVLEQITGFGRDRISKFLEEFTKLSMVISAGTSRKKLVNILKTKIKIKKEPPTEEEGPEEEQ